MSGFDRGADGLKQRNHNAALRHWCMRLVDGDDSASVTVARCRRGVGHSAPGPIPERRPFRFTPSRISSRRSPFTAALGAGLRPTSRGTGLIYRNAIFHIVSFSGRLLPCYGPSLWMQWPQAPKDASSVLNLANTISSRESRRKASDHVGNDPCPCSRLAKVSACLDVRG
jgi:hypothetical protein